MKILSQIAAVSLMFLIVLISSCKKDGYNQPTAQCSLTHSEDDLFGYSFNIVYNSIGNPASTDFGGFISNMEYDVRKRLSKVTFGTQGGRLEYCYSNNTFLPTARKYIRPDFWGLIAVDSFSYNLIGQRTKRVLHNILSGNTYIYRYQYDNKANLKTITLATIINGVESSPSLRYEGLRYDNKYNAFSGNQWLKYLLDYTDFDDYNTLQLSVNNALDWKWYYSNDYPYYSNVFSYKFTSSFSYNSQGFAQLRNGRFFDTDGVTEIGSFTQSNISTCDTNSPNLNQNNSAFKVVRNDMLNNILHLPYANKKY